MQWRIWIAFGQSATAADPTYTDVSAWARKRKSPLSVQAGQEREQSGTSSPGTLTVDLDNGDHRFTTGQSWAITDSLQAKAELVVDGVVCPVISGWILLPEQDAWTEADNANLVSITIIDRLGREQLAQEMDSLLVEHIAAVGGSRLIGFWPLGETAEPVGLSSVPGMPNLVRLEATDYGLTADAATFTAGSGDAPPGDEMQPGVLSPTSRNTAGTIDTAYSYFRADLSADPIVLEPGQTLTLVAWTRITDSDTAADNDATVLELRGAASESVRVTRSQVALGWNAVVNDGAGWVADIDNFKETDGRVAIAYLNVELTTGDQTFAIATGDGRSTFTDTAGTPPADLTLTELLIGVYARGSIWCVQFYLCDTAEAFSLTELDTQRDVGFRALADQRVDERFAALASYAGIDPGDLVLDPCVARMQALQTRGRLPLELMQTAVTTEQGRMFADGDRRLVLHSRRRRYLPSDH